MDHLTVPLDLERLLPPSARKLKSSHLCTRSIMYKGHLKPIEALGSVGVDDQTAQLDSRLRAELSLPDGSRLQLLAVEGLIPSLHTQQQVLAARSVVRGSDTRVPPRFFTVCSKRSIPFI